MSLSSFGLIYLIISISLLAILIKGWENKESLEKRIFLLIVLSTSVWNFSNAMRFLSLTKGSIIFWHEFKFLGIIPIPTLFLVFILAYCKRNVVLNNKYFKFIYIIPLTILISVITNPILHLFRKNIYVLTLYNIPVVKTVNGVFFWVNTAYTYSILILTILILIYRFKGLPKYYRSQPMIILLGLLPPMLINVLFVSNSLKEQFDYTSIGFMFSAIIFYWALYHYRTNEIVPIARDIVIENMNDLIVVLDVNRRIIDANLAVKTLMENLNIDYANNGYEEILQVFINKTNAELIRTAETTEISLTINSEIKYYSLRESNINHTTHFLGYVVIFYDISPFKKMMLELETMATKDYLTDLYNRIYLDKYILNLDIAGLLPFCVIKASINGLKIINSGLGINTGDTLIINASNLLKNISPSNSIIARIGGDEFAVLIPNFTEKDTSNLIDSFKTDALNYNVGLANLSLSFGFSIISNTNENIFDHLSLADTLMYKSKMLESQSTRSSLIESLKTALEQSDYETKAHADRTQDLAIKLGKSAGLSENIINDLSMLALLHDIGKIGIPDNILLKPAKLTFEEFEIIKTHTQKGYEIAKSSPDLVSIAKGILHHHERYDGKGYPVGLKGEEIPIISRIITIVDSFDVMTNDRPYHKAISQDDAIEELIRCRGTQFDPILVDKMIELLSK